MELSFPSRFVINVQTSSMPAEVPGAELHWNSFKIGRGSKREKKRKCCPTPTADFNYDSIQSVICKKKKNKKEKREKQIKTKNKNYQSKN